MEINFLTVIFTIILSQIKSKPKVDGRTSWRATSWQLTNDQTQSPNTKDQEKVNLRVVGNERRRTSQALRQQTHERYHSKTYNPCPQFFVYLATKWLLQEAIRFNNSFQLLGFYYIIDDKSAFRFFSISKQLRSNNFKNSTKPETLLLQHHLAWHPRLLLLLHRRSLRKNRLQDDISSYGPCF